MAGPFYLNRPKWNSKNKISFGRKGGISPLMFWDLSITGGMTAKILPPPCGGLDGPRTSYSKPDKL